MCVCLKLVYVENFWWVWCVVFYVELVCLIVCYVVVIEWDYCYWIVLYDVDFVDGCCGCFGCECCVEKGVVLLVE